jgi:polar amino acid transport system permease protein
MITVRGWAMPSSHLKRHFKLFNHGGIFLDHGRLSVEPSLVKKIITYLQRSLAVAVVAVAFLAALYYLIQAQGYDFRWSAAFDYLPALNKGLGNTLVISSLSLVFAVLLGVIVGMGRLSKITIVRDLCMTYVHALRNIPLLVVVLIAYFGFGGVFPQLGSYFWGILALTVLEAAYIAEIVRSGIGAIHKEQTESAHSLGMNYFQTMRYIILPQALRNILPALTGQLVILIKDSSLVMVIGIMELTLTARYLLSVTFAAMEIYALTAVYYFVVCFGLSMVSNYLERRFAIAKGQ